MMVRTYADRGTKTYVTFGNVNGLKFNRQPLTAHYDGDNVDIDLPDDIADNHHIDHWYIQSSGDVTVNWVAWSDEDGDHLLLSEHAIFVMNDAGATIDRIGEL